MNDKRVEKEADICGARYVVAAWQGVLRNNGKAQ